LESGGPVIVVAVMFVKPEQRAEVEIALLKQVAAVQANEAGALLFAAHATADGFVLIEKWESAISLDAHVTGKAISEFRTVLDPARSGPSEILTMTAIPAGDPLKGRL
jgi:quinol monooxygenase YgiN